MYCWTTFDSWIIDASECLTSSATRTNHHGLMGGRSYYTYEWTVRYHFNDASKTCCVIRSCYNITTDDYQACVKLWQNFHSFDGNRDGNPQQKSRGYVFVNNPRVDSFGNLFNDIAGNGLKIQLQLAINTNHFSRTFQDRTHCFQIKERHDCVESDAEIISVTIQGMLSVFLFYFVIRLVTVCVVVVLKNTNSNNTITNTNR